MTLPLALLLPAAFLVLVDVDDDVDDDGDDVDDEDVDAALVADVARLLSRGGTDAVAAARAVLEARDDAPLRTARARMEEAAAGLHFERAAVWRDKAERLAWLWGRVTRFQASMDHLTFCYTVPPVHERDAGRVYLVRRGTVRAEVPMPATESERTTLDALAARVFLAPEGGADGEPAAERDVPQHDLDEFYLVASWFRRRPAELARTERFRSPADQRAD